MTIYGREVHFLLTVGAQYAIQKLSKTDRYLQTVGAAVILSQNYEDRMKQEDDSYVKRPLTVEEVQTLTEKEFSLLCEELEKAIKDGSERTVEVEENKKNETRTSS